MNDGPVYLREGSGATAEAPPPPLGRGDAAQMPRSDAEILKDLKGQGTSKKSGGSRALGRRGKGVFHVPYQAPPFPGVACRPRPALSCCVAFIAARGASADSELDRLEAIWSRGDYARATQELIA